MVLYCSAYWDLQLKLKNKKKKGVFFTTGIWSFVVPFSLVFKIVYWLHCVCELHLRDADILKFALLFRLVFGIWRRLFGELQRNWQGQDQLLGKNFEYKLYKTILIKAHICYIFLQPCCTTHSAWRFAHDRIWI